MRGHIKPYQKNQSHELITAHPRIMQPSHLDYIKRGTPNTGVQGHIPGSSPDSGAYMKGLIGDKLPTVPGASAQLRSL
jgi:hypothetical protein